MNLKPHIVFFEGNPRFTLGGGQRVTLDLMEALSDRYQIHLIEIGRTPKFFEDARRWTQHTLRLHFPASSRPTTRASYNFSRLEILAFPILSLIGLGRTLWFLLKHGLFPHDTIIYSAAKKSFFLCAPLKLLGYRVIFHLHTADSKENLLFSLLRWLAGRMNLVLFASEYTKNHFALANSAVLPLCVRHFAKVPKKFPVGPRIVASLSSLTGIKGIEDFLLSRKYLSNAGLYEYWVIGDGEERKSLEALAIPGVRFYGHQENPWPILKDSVHALVFPTRVPETFGLALLEAMSCGVPFVTTNLGNQAEFSQRYMRAPGVPPGSPQAIAAAIEDLFSDPTKYENLSRMVWEGSHEFTFEKFRAHSQSLFSRLLK